MLFTLVTPEKKIITEMEVDEILAPGSKGQLDILPGHSPLVTTLATGILKYKQKGQSKYNPISLSWGYLEVTPQGVSVLAETAETPEELEKERAEEALARAQIKLKEGLTVGDIMKYQRKKQRAQSRLELIKSYSKN
ncbi:MAG: ATP synthase F1 subunit epsilon [Bdellovibrionaceae bacterium]|nr:ATP synthase F1 subunit epsilon [Pseudobdellovibrionaceae bacterium]